MRGELTYEDAMRRAWSTADDRTPEEARVWLDIARELGDHGPIPPSDLASFIEPDKLTKLAELIDHTRDGGPPGLIDWIGIVEEIVWPEGRLS